MIPARLAVQAASDAALLRYLLEESWTWLTALVRREAHRRLAERGYVRYDNEP